MHRVMASLPPTYEADASKRFDKQELLQFHDLVRHRLENIPADIFQPHDCYFTDSIASSRPASSLLPVETPEPVISGIPLERLDPISLTQLQVWQVLCGRVLYGTLCAEAFLTSGIIMTMLEDANGDAVRLAIYNAAHSQTNIKSVYPKGAKLAIRDPYLKRDGDGCLGIRIDNPANIEMHVSNPEKDSPYDIDVLMEAISSLP